LLAMLREVAMFILPDFVFLLSSISLCLIPWD
jgi:hypothetical protein